MHYFFQFFSCYMDVICDFQFELISLYFAIDFAIFTTNGRRPMDGRKNGWTGIKGGISMTELLKRFAGLGYVRKQVNMLPFQSRVFWDFPFPLPPPTSPHYQLDHRIFYRFLRDTLFTNSYSSRKSALVLLE